MRSFEELHSISEVDEFITNYQLSLLFISRTNCSVCHGLMPQIQELMAHYPNIELGHINADHVQDIAGRFSIFTVPVILVFVDGKEYIREARIVHMDLFNEKINKIYTTIAE